MVQNTIGLTLNIARIIATKMKYSIVVQYILLLCEVVLILTSDLFLNISYIPKQHQNVKQQQQQLVGATTMCNFNCIRMLILHFQYSQIFTNGQMNVNERILKHMIWNSYIQLNQWVYFIELFIFLFYDLYFNSNDISAKTKESNNISLMVDPKQRPKKQRKHRKNQKKKDKQPQKYNTEQKNNDNQCCTWMCFVLILFFCLLFLFFCFFVRCFVFCLSFFVFFVIVFGCCWSTKNNKMHVTSTDQPPTSVLWDCFGCVTQCVIFK